MSYLRCNYDQIELSCAHCDDKFLTIQCTSNGDIYDFCCSSHCYELYYSQDEVRDRKLNLILNV